MCKVPVKKKRFFKILNIFLAFLYILLLQLQEKIIKVCYIMPNLDYFLKSLFVSIKKSKYQIKLQH